jgi:uncharacterized membrane protein (UPF0136 family)
MPARSAVDKNFMTPTAVLWIYIVLLVAGGAMGFVKAKSKMSLIMSLAFAVPLALSAAAILPLSVGMVLVGLLLVFFGMRFFKTRAMMPGGVMALLSALTLVLLIALA